MFEKYLLYLTVKPPSKTRSQNQTSLIHMLGTTVNQWNRRLAESGPRFTKAPTLRVANCGTKPDECIRFVSICNNIDKVSVWYKSYIAIYIYSYTIYIKVLVPWCFNTSFSATRKSLTKKCGWCCNPQKITNPTNTSLVEEKMWHVSLRSSAAFFNANVPIAPISLPWHPRASHARRLR